MSAEAELERRQRLEADVDSRLVDLWAALWGGGLEPNDTVAACIRAAYATGYRDALIETRQGRSGELHRRHGYALP